MGRAASPAHDAIIRPHRPPAAAPPSPIHKHTRGPAPQADKMGAHVRLAGPDYDEHVALNPQEEEEPPLFYYKDDPNRDSRSVRGCFLDEIYAKPRLEQKLADLYFDGDVPYMRDNVHQLSDAQWRCFFEGYLVEPLPRQERKYAVVFYGVSGYTGSLVMEYLKRECLDDVSVCFAGRTLHKVIAMRDKVLAGTRWASCDCISCDLKEPFEVEALVSSCRVVCNIAGPFMLTGGERLVEACIHYDTDYCDVSGEIPWSAKLLEFHDVARDAGVYIVPSTAYAGGAISASRRVVVSSLC